MPPVATLVPDESDLLCEGCGYRLKALSRQGSCPECGKPIAQSIDQHRRPPAWELNCGWDDWLNRFM